MIAIASIIGYTLAAAAYYGWLSTRALTVGTPAILTVQSFEEEQSRAA